MPSVRCLRQPSANCRALPRSVGVATRHTQNQIIVRYSGVLYKARYAMGAPCFGACSPARSSPSFAPSRGAPLSCGSFLALFRFAACARHSPRFGWLVPRTPFALPCLRLFCGGRPPPRVTRSVHPTGVPRGLQRPRARSSRSRPLRSVGSTSRPPLLGGYAP